MSLTLFSLTLIGIPSALFTASRCLAIFKLADKQVFATEGVIIGAIRSLSKLLNPSTIRVFGARKQSQVVRVNAPLISAHVVNRKVSNDVAYKQFVGCPVRHQLALYVRPKSFLDLPVSSLVERTKPLPTFRSDIELDHLRKPVQQRPEWLTRNLRILGQSLDLSFRQPFFLPANGFGIGGWLNQIRSGGVRRVLSSFVPLAVVLVGHCLKVIWVNARTIAASMMDFISMWNIPDKDFVRNPVGVPTRLLAKAVMLKLPVAFASLRGCPFPTSAFSVQFKLLYETIKDWSVGWHISGDKKPTPTSEVKPAVNRGNAYQGGQDMFSRFWRLLQSRALMVPIPA